MTLHFGDRRSAALPRYINCTEITVLCLREQKLYPVRFLVPAQKLSPIVRTWPEDALIVHTVSLFKTKEARLILQSGIYIYNFTNISEGTAFLLQVLTFNEEVKLRRYNLNQRIACNMIL